MRPVLAVIGIAVVAIIISALVAPPGKKDLTPSVQERDDKRRQDPTPTNAGTPAAGAAVLPAPDPFNPPAEGAINAIITVKGRGDIGVQLYPKAAPKTVARIVELFNSKFYDGIKIHRVETGFVVQAGDPETRTQGVDAPGIGSHGSGQTIPFEKNTLQNVTGSMSMALSQAASDTGDSQWFINLSNNHALDNQYCVFGKVTSGLDKVGQIKKGDTIEKIVVVK
jgi:cyclophilin family peptidyl-prolyl cis-trans isomerase